MTFLDIFNRVPLSVVLPITILVLGLILYFKFPKNRKDIGIVYSSLGIVGVFIYSVSFYIDTLSYGFPFVLLGVLIVEIATVIVGVYSFKNNKKNTIHIMKK